MLIDMAKQRERQRGRYGFRRTERILEAEEATIYSYAMHVVRRRWERWVVEKGLPLK